MKLGTDDVKFALGSDEVDKICLGIEEVWANFVPFYVINNGQLIDGNYTSANRIMLNIHTTQYIDYGANGHSSSAGDSIAGAKVYFETRGCKNIRVVAEANQSAAHGYLNFTVYSGSTVIANEQTYDLTLRIDEIINVDEYESITVEITSNELGASDKTWLSAKITEIYCIK